LAGNLNADFIILISSGFSCVISDWEMVLYFLFVFLEFVLPGAALVSDLGRVVVETETEKRQTGQYRDQNPQSED
jgi:hypothetical protein